MKILAIDAATEACSVALKMGDEVISQFEVAPQQHSQKLLPFVDEILAQGGIKLSQLDAIAFGRGPGSFTGVRIGVAVTQGLAFGADLPVVGISNLAAMAQQAIVQEQAKQVVSAIDARMSEVYFAIYTNDNGVAKLASKEIVRKPELLESADLAEAVSVGTGWQTYESVLCERFACTKTEIVLPSAEFMLPLAEIELAAGNGVSAEQAQPNYVRDEVSWQKLPGR